MRFATALFALVAALAAPLASCGGDDRAASAGATRVAETGERVLPADFPRDLPPPLAALAEQANQLLDGGAPAFERRLEELRGHPVVVNKWASWCHPCRAEFPFFAAQAEKRAGEVAFLGVNSSDDPEPASAFLEELPVPYPSYLDPDLEVAETFNGVAAFPTTAFFDEKGELVYLKQGGYASEELLAEDIEHYLGG